MIIRVKEYEESHFGPKPIYTDYRLQDWGEDKFKERFKEFEVAVNYVAPFRAEVKAAGGSRFYTNILDNFIKALKEEIANAREQRSRGE